MAKIQKLLFVDTNIWLDFYRARGDSALTLLNHLETVSDKIIVPYQLEMEFKKNRHDAIKEGLQSLKGPDSISRPAFFSDAQAVKSMSTAIRAANKQVKLLRAKYPKVLANPAANDPVYQSVQRIFHKNDALVWKKESEDHKAVYDRAFKRFLHGCPPRKKNDTSMGDALNWEWVLHCCIQKKAELVIVTRDSDYGYTLDKNTYINDYLKHEFNEIVSQKRKILITEKLSEALKHFNISVSAKEREEEEQLITEAHAPATSAETKESELIGRLLSQILEQGSGTSDADYEPNNDNPKSIPEKEIEEVPEKSKLDEPKKTVAAKNEEG